MLNLTNGAPLRNCMGMGRRTALKVGALGFFGMSLVELERLKAAEPSRSTGKSVILVWLDGGPSHIDSYDPKPDAPPEYRGPWGTLATNVPGIRISETIPNHARHMDKAALLRSLHHGTGDHFAAGHWMLTGRAGSTSVSPAPMYPSIASYITRTHGPLKAGMPAYVGLPAAESIYLFPGYHGSAYLGGAYNPFDADPVTKYLHWTSNVDIKLPKVFENASEAVDRIETRRDLLVQFDRLRREMDRTGRFDTLDRFQQNAMNLLLGSQVRQAFDLSQEKEATVAKYGKNPWGKYTLLARRMVEAGTTFVTVDMPHWDNHSQLLESHGPNLNAMDQAVGALLDDLQERRLLDQTLVVVMGEFGRTPKINAGQPGIPIPGRDHWGEAFSVMLAGGGVRGGQVVGATNARGEHPTDRPLTPADLAATIYQIMGVDPKQTFLNHAGRPIPILEQGKVIHELL